MNQSIQFSVSKNLKGVGAKAIVLSYVPKFKAGEGWVEQKH